MPSEEITYRKSIDDKPELILKQTTTNDRVSRLENWRWFVSGGLAIITVVLIPIALIIIQHYL